jgi:beta-galactosidase
MSDHYPPINPKYPHFLHGGDYNPDQWIRTPAIWTQDMRLMKLANCNAMSVGIFAWAALEPEEGRFEFGWLDRIMDLLAQNGGYTVLATPSGARPAWLSQKYPEVLRVRPDRGRNLHGRRHNHCYTSPIYREKCDLINTRLAERYKDHPALLVWHLSNEYGGECHCDLCQEAFRAWLRERYEDDLDQLNHAWWTAFWSHTYSDWSQVESPSPIGETSVHGHTLDWKRFVTHQTIDFFRDEAAPLKEITPDIPVTTNFMGTYTGLDYWKFAPEVDVVSWDSYPMWHREGGDDVSTAVGVAFVHDLNRSLKGGKPFMLMESVPSATNWMQVCKRKRPGMHLLSSLQAVAHGSDTVQYFQWRKSRGSSEKFHGAVVDHVGHENTRVFRDVAEVGASLKKLDAVVGTTVRPEVAVIYDWECRWAIDQQQGLGHEIKRYQETCQNHYRPFWELGIPVDVIDQTCELSKYRLVVAPMAHMLRPGFADRVEKFVADGGTLVMTYWSGVVDESDLCFLGGWPGGALRQVLGIWDEETDCLHPGETNRLVCEEGNALGLSGEYEAREICALVHAEGAEVLGTYGDEFYASRPALTRHAYGEGEAYYIATRTGGAFLNAFYGQLADRLSLRRVLSCALPEGVSAQVRGDGEREFVFLMNFARAERTVSLGTESFQDILTGQPVEGDLPLKAFGVAVLQRC